MKTSPWLETLLGSADAARKRVEELTKFAGQTPFLEMTFMNHRVSWKCLRGRAITGKGLKLVGDVAAGTKQNIKMLLCGLVAFMMRWHQGRPVGEMTARLQRNGSY